MAKKVKGAVVDWIDGIPLVFLPNFVGTPYELYPVRRLFSAGQDNLKTAKNDYESCGLALSPHKQAGIGNVCASASPGCVKTCLDETGNGNIFPFVKAARQAKTIVFQTERDWFLDQFDLELRSWELKAKRADSLMACRPNLFSDVRWEKYVDLESYRNTMFYDYSKHVGRYGLVRSNYWVTFSRSETNEKEALEVLANAGNVAVVFYDNHKPRMGHHAKFQQIPRRWFDYEVVDGDKTDARFDDPRGRKYGRVIGLRLKAATWDKYHEAIKKGFAVPTF